MARRLNDLQVVRASELAQHAFCARAWWLGCVKGVHPANRTALARGIRLHEAHGQLAHDAWVWQRWAYLFLALAGIAGLALVVLSVLSH